MFIRNRKGADLIPTLLTALAAAALGLAFIARLSGGVKTSGNQISESASSLGDKLQQEIDAIQ